MDSDTPDGFTALAGDQLIATGALPAVLSALLDWRDQHGTETTLYWLFDDATGRNLEIDFRGEAASIEARLRAQLPPPTQLAPPPAAPRSGPGRPKLGVVAREVTLLPQHWDWLARQPGGASVALRKLVHAASKASAAEDRARESLEAAHRAMLVLGGSLPGFEEASRAMFKGRFAEARACLTAWPTDLAAYASRLLAVAERHAQTLQAAGTDQPPA